MHYRLIALDLDGTLLGPDGRISPANLAAVTAAHAAGAQVVPCTGRAWCEARHALATFPADGPGVFVGGAAVSDLASGRSLDIAVIEPELARRIVAQLEDGPEAVLVFRDRGRTGHDYLVTGRGELSRNTQWWFEVTGAAVHFQRQLNDASLHHALRVGIVGPGPRVQQVCRDVAAALGEQVIVQSFEGVQRPDPGQSIHVMEVFARGVDKWRGITWLAERHHFGPDQIAVIGDQINDLAMLSGAGCGIAMGNAIPAAKDEADYVTRSNTEDGVAFAIEQLLAGKW